jgi:hypothetical protein
MKCCGENRATKFCPECGKPLVNEPILQLLKHCTQHVRVRKNAIKNARALNTKGNATCSKEWRDHSIEKEEATFVKWQSWESALEELITTTSAGRLGLGPNDDSCPFD